ncbi:MAG: hypothetical protein MPJ50_14570 [Pirellulales bacterium]|nr:hypothetical protein [Pirellulales bacterium]
MSSFNNPYQAPQGAQGPAPFHGQPLKQSTWGKISFIIGLVCLGILLVFFLFSMVIAEADLGGTPSDVAGTFMGLACCGSLVANLAGIVFGVVGLVEQNRKRGLAITGLILNILPPLFVLASMLFGAYMINQMMDGF